MSDLRRLRTKLCRELVQSEHSATVYATREARRLGDVGPAQALLAVASHARDLRPRFEMLMSKRQPLGLGIGRSVSQLIASLRHALFDRLVDTERSYRATLLGLRHGIDVTRLLREVARREGDPHLVMFCDELLAERLEMIAQAEQAMSWFAECPGRALRSGLRMALEPGAR